ncbi:MAG: hypothetical protein ABR574_12415 [Cryomorphaceae bacterium]
MRIHLILIGFLSVVLLGCDPFYYADPVDPRLPEFTADGENKAGAYIDGYAWRTSGSPSIVYYSTSDSTVVTFPTASLISGSDEYDPNADVSFLLRGDFFRQITETPLSGPLEIILDGTENQGKLTLSEDYGPTTTCANGTGKLIIRNVFQRETDWVVAGTFGFDISTPCGQHTVHQGRFDFRVDS